MHEKTGCHIIGHFKQGLILYDNMLIVVYIFFIFSRGTNLTYTYWKLKNKSVLFKSIYNYESLYYFKNLKQLKYLKTNGWVLINITEFYIDRIDFNRIRFSVIHSNYSVLIKTELLYKMVKLWKCDWERL